MALSLRTHIERVRRVIGHGADDADIQHLERGSSRAGSQEHQLNNRDMLGGAGGVERLPPFHIRAFQPLRISGMSNERV